MKLTEGYKKKLKHKMFMQSIVFYIDFLQIISNITPAILTCSNGISQLKRYPLIDGKEYTFYHMTHEGDIEHNRIPDLRRMERIAWPRPMIDDSEHPYLKVWRNTRRGKGGAKERILILHTEESYLVVLDDRKNYILPWTAYLLRSKHEVEKKLKEYENYINTETTSEN